MGKTTVEMERMNKFVVSIYNNTFYTHHFTITKAEHIKYDASIDIQ